MKCYLFFRRHLWVLWVRRSRTLSYSYSLEYSYHLLYHTPSLEYSFNLFYYTPTVLSTVITYFFILLQSWVHLSLTLIYSYSLEYSYSLLYHSSTVLSTVITYFIILLLVEYSNSYFIILLQSWVQLSLTFLYSYSLEYIHHLL